MKRTALKRRTPLKRKSPKPRKLRTRWRRKLAQERKAAK